MADPTPTPEALDAAVARLTRLASGNSVAYVGAVNPDDLRLVLDALEARRAPCGECARLASERVRLRDALLDARLAATRLQSSLTEALAPFAREAAAGPHQTFFESDRSNVIFVDPRCAAESNLGRCTLGPAHAGEHQYYAVLPMAQAKIDAALAGQEAPRRLARGRKSR